MPVFPENNAIRFLNRVEKPVRKLFEAINSEESDLAETIEKLPIDKQVDNPEDLEALHYKYSRRFSAASKSETLETKFNNFVIAQNSAFVFNSFVISLGPLYGALLQIAKQLISYKYANNGRTLRRGKKIANIYLPQIIFDARNQSMHFEEGKVKRPILDTFKILRENFGDSFNYEQFPGRNYARSVVKPIGWAGSDGFMKDLEEILK